MGDMLQSRKENDLEDLLNNLVTIGGSRVIATTPRNCVGQVMMAVGL